MKVYVATAGSYDDYCVVAVASTPERAKLYTRYGSDGFYEVEVDSGLERLLSGQVRWHVHLRRDGVCLSAYPDCSETMEGHELKPIGPWHQLHVQHFADSKEAAIEYAQGVREALIDRQKWPKERPMDDQGIHPLV